MQSYKKSADFLSQLPVEMKLLLELIKTNTDGIVIEKFKAKDINWSKFYQLAIHHRTIPLLYSKLNKLKLNWIPIEVLNRLQNKYQQNVFSMLKITSEMGVIASLFNSNNIKVLFLKGPILGKELYGDISLRTSKDIDILIPFKDIKRTKQLLLKHGYKEKEETEFILNEHKWRAHHLVFYQPDSNIYIEIHWRLNELPDKEPSFDSLWGRKNISPLTLEPIYTLGREDLFLYLASHGARHGWFRLRWLVDVDRLMKNNTPFKRMDTIIREYENEHVVGQALILTNQLLKTPISNQLSPYLRNRSIRLASLAMVFISSIDHDQPFPRELIPFPRSYAYELQKNLSQKLKFLLISSYPTYKDYQVFKLPRNLHFLYFPLRPFLYTGRKLGILKAK